ncbi:HBL391Cp [Eremothecium sinecaudum]|uniref:DNA mismatch repair protein MSH2 n=1 Tax=Eremothecium sinecaudum TaxID=45286 RepID=A0A120K0P3_9SACH|nr:HBL391Cp [Eremothecium sinecaudum]AMD18511.1 HBL391Cp [Eremothecium sinecaudum]
MSSVRPELKFSDVSEERGFYRRFFKLPKKVSKVMRIVDRGEYYTIIGQDAVFVAENIYHTTSALKDFRVDSTLAQQVDEPLKYITISPQVISALLKTCLLEQGFKIEIYDKSWKLLKSASPGNIDQVEDLMSISLESSIVLAGIKFQLNAQEGHCVLGVSFVDSSSYEIGMFDIVDNEVYSNLESFLIQLGVRECLLPDVRNNESMSSELRKMNTVMDRCGCIVTFLKSGEFTSKDVESDLVKLCGDDLAMSLPNYSQLSLSACNALLRYLELPQDVSKEGKYKLVKHSLAQFMKLDSSAIKALNIFTQGPSAAPSVSSTTGYGNGGKITSLVQLLNKCKTNAGVRLLNEWLKQPLCDYTEIQKRHDLVDYLVDQLELKSMLRDDYLPLVPDVRRLTKKLNKNGNLEDVLKIYQFAQRIPEINGLLKDNLQELPEQSRIKELVTQTWLEPLEKHIQPLQKFQEMVETTVDLEAYEETNEFMIKVEFNEELARIRSALVDLKDKMRSIHLETAEDLGFEPEKKLKLENHHVHGWCMRLTRTDAKALRQHKKYVELSTVKAGIYFSTKEFKQIAEEIAELQQEYDKQQSSLVKEIITITISYTPVLEKLSIVLAKLDVLCSFAHVSSYAPIPYVRPTMYDIDDPNRKTKLIESRHPLIEVQDDITFIANDIIMERGAGEFLIITGPNMGGKSTYIRQAGVISLMAQIGCFVPCTSAEIAIVDAILCRVGAGDSQLKGVSTFMIEMLETASILKNATSNSLIIVDELGRGTSTYDGFGLAWSISEYIAKEIKSFTLFATHFHELTTLAEKYSNVKNMHVIAHIEEGPQKSDDITLLYKVEEGISDQSFGIHVAEAVHFPQKIVKMAKRKATELDELQRDSEALKKLKCSPEQIAQGTEALTSLLKKWVAELRLQGLDRKLSDAKVQEDIVKQLRELLNEPNELSGLADEFKEWIVDLLL